MADAVEWIESPRLARRLEWTIAIGAVAVLIVFAILYLRFPSTFGGSVSALLILAVLWLAALGETPRRAALDGSTLRVKYVLGERNIPLGEVIALDLAPGPTRETATLRMALRSSSRTYGVTLERPAADDLASRLERFGFFVNRTPPPRVPVPNRA